MKTTVQSGESLALAATVVGVDAFAAPPFIAPTPANAAPVTSPAHTTAFAMKPLPASIVPPSEPGPTAPRRSRQPLRSAPSPPPGWSAEGHDQVGATLGRGDQLGVALVAAGDPVSGLLGRLAEPD